MITQLLSDKENRKEKYVSNGKEYKQGKWDNYNHSREQLRLNFQNVVLGKTSGTTAWYVTEDMESGT